MILMVWGYRPHPAIAVQIKEPTQPTQSVVPTRGALLQISQSDVSLQDLYAHRQCSLPILFHIY
jgi:hypothetical protein